MSYITMTCPHCNMHVRYTLVEIARAALAEPTLADKSTRAIAKLIGVSHSTIYLARRALTDELLL